MYPSFLFSFLLKTLFSSFILQSESLSDICASQSTPSDESEARLAGLMVLSEAVSNLQPDVMKQLIGCSEADSDAIENTVNFK